MCRMVGKQCSHKFAKAQIKKQGAAICPGTRAHLCYLKVLQLTQNLIDGEILWETPEV